MDTRVLYLTAIIIAAISGGYYYYSGKGNKLQTDSARSMTYSANNINLTQTDEKGMLSVRAQVDQRTKPAARDFESQNLQATTYKDGQVDATFFAKQGNGYDDNTKVVLSQEVLATKIMQNGKMQFRTEELTAFRKHVKLKPIKLSLLNLHRLNLSVRA